MTGRRIDEGQCRAFVHQLRREERSAATIRKYLREIRAFAAFWGSRPVDSSAAARWRDALQAQGLAASTINGKLPALDRFFSFLGWEECCARHLKIQRKTFRDAGRELTREDYERLTATAEKQGKSRLALLMEAICATGIRVSEVQYITVEAARAGRAEVALKGKIRTILIPSKLCRKLLKYAKQQKTASGEIFLTRNGTPLSRRQIWAEMKGLCKTAGVAASEVFPHNLRHLFAAAFYRASRDIVKLADVLGHSSLETTRIYLLTSGAEHIRTLDRLRLVC